MIDKDTATGLAGALVLVAAMAGVFFYERAQFETHEIEWEQTTATRMSDTGETLAEGESAEYTLTAEADRMAQVRAEVSWSDDVDPPDTFGVAVEGPSEEYTDSDSGESSPLEVTVPVRQEPEADTATGRSMEDARDQLNQTASWMEGTGEWTLTVTLDAAPGGNLPGQEDGSQAYDVTIEVDRWEPVFQ